MPLSFRTFGVHLRQLWVGFVGRVLYIEGSTGETLNVRSLISDIRLILVARPSG